MDKRSIKLTVTVSMRDGREMTADLPLPSVLADRVAWERQFRAGPGFRLDQAIQNTLAYSFEMSRRASDAKLPAKQRRKKPEPLPDESSLVPDEWLAFMAWLALGRIDDSVAMMSFEVFVGEVDRQALDWDVMPEGKPDPTVPAAVSAPAPTPTS